MITGSQTVPVITFIKFSFLKNKQTKKNHCLDIVFFISQTWILFSKQTSNYSNDIFFFVEYVDLWTVRTVSQQFDSVFYLCLVIQKSRCVSELNDWGVRACFVRMCVFVSVHLSVCAWVTDVMGCIANWINPVLQVRKGRVPLVKKEKITACNYRL